MRFAPRLIRFEMFRVVARCFEESSMDLWTDRWGCVVGILILPAISGLSCGLVSLRIDRCLNSVSLRMDICSFPVSYHES
jgi:hypothetical protein